MLLAIDIGNTNITLGVFEDRELLGKFRMTTMMSRTSDEYGITLRELLRNQNMNPDEIDAVIIASVVPDIMHSFSSAIIKYFGHKPAIVSAGIKTGIRVATENPRQTGPDRIVDAVAAYKLYGGPLIVVDFGTATTFLKASSILPAEGFPPNNSIFCRSASALISTLLIFLIFPAILLPFAFRLAKLPRK